ncbi:hypothetical protein YC2023_023038 [Brassica napus]
MVYLLLYVDDMLIASKKMSTIQNLKDQLSMEFEMKDLGAARRILGMDIIRNKDNHILKLSQNDYLAKVLKTFGMSECRPVNTPLGSQFKLQALTANQEREQEGALGLNLTFAKGEDFKVRGYCDSDYASDMDRSRSITGYVFTVGGNAVSWSSSLYKVVALSTTEAEYMALSDAVREGIWLKGICKELKLSDEEIEMTGRRSSSWKSERRGGAENQHQDRQRTTSSACRSCVMVSVNLDTEVTSRSQGGDCELWLST